MLTILPESTFAYEPLREDFAVELVGEGKLDQYVLILDIFFNCKDSTGSFDAMIAKRGKGSFKQCPLSNPLVAKTIRLRKDTIEEWKRTDPENLSWLKVIQLVRDPRARYNSMLKASKFFPEKIKKFEKACQLQLEDLKIKDLVPQEKYMTICNFSDPKLFIYCSVINSCAMKT